MAEAEETQGRRALQVARANFQVETLRQFFGARGTWVGFACVLSPPPSLCIDFARTGSLLRCQGTYRLRIGSYHGSRTRIWHPRRNRLAHA